MTPQLSLAKRLASAYNYSYEATMNEYSMESINAAAQRIAVLKVEAAARGVNPDDLIEWSPMGHWRPKNEEDR